MSEGKWQLWFIWSHSSLWYVSEILSYSKMRIFAHIFFSKFNVLTFTVIYFIIWNYFLWWDEINYIYIFIMENQLLQQCSLNGPSHLHWFVMPSLPYQVSFMQMLYSMLFCSIGLTWSILLQNYIVLLTTALW